MVFWGRMVQEKTTSIRLILGLLRALEGEIFIFGENIRKTYPKHLARIGSLIENPSLYGHLSARDNLRIWVNYFGVSNDRIGKVLELVNLQKTGKKKISDFSTGMKQRLGLATALLHDPELLILDEPTNGLDPMGIIELRTILKRLQGEGQTVLLSSHILSEVEKLVTHIGVIKGGKVVFEGDMQVLQELRQQNLTVQIKVGNVQKALEVIGGAEQMVGEEQLIHFVLEGEAELPFIVRRLVEADVEVYRVIPVANNLEELFLSLNETK